jgi:glutathione synthase/RimK-type ligase-like ATP-grasp enzyme
MQSKLHKPIAIHFREGGFTSRFIEYCDKHSIPYKRVSCYDNDIVDQLKGCAALVWHWNHVDFRDQILARNLITILSGRGIKIFPDYWNNVVFDDKIAQKYLLKTIDAPLVPTFIFYSKEIALNWAENTDYPKVFKLRGGAGSSNVKLIYNKNQAKRIISRSFNRGFPLYDRYSGFSQRLWVFKRDRNFASFVHVLKGLVRLIKPKERIDLLPTQKGYVYFQEYIPNNEYDTRLIIIGDRCFGLRRFIRKNDFRASGSGLLDYDKNNINIDAVKIAFEISGQLNTRSLALDFILDNNDNPILIEMSYAFPAGSFTDNCTGYWDKDLIWHEGAHNLQDLIMEDFIAELTES